MNLVFDIGNTNVKWAVFDKNKLMECKFIKNFSRDVFSDIISNYLDVKIVCVANNGKSINYIEDICDKYNIRVINVNHLTNMPIQIQYETPQTLGADRIALAVGASRQYLGNKLIIDLGTCITYDIVLENQYIGGQISPGLSMRLSSMHCFTNKLPNIDFKYVDTFLGENTNNSMLIGVFDSVLFEIQNVIEKYKSRYPSILIILTGGDAKIIESKIKYINFFNPYLLMEGLNYIIAFNEEA